MRNAILGFLILLGTAYAQTTGGTGVNTATVAGTGGTGSGTVNANSGSANAIAIYPAAGGSTTVGPDATLTDDGTNLTYSGTDLILPTGTCATAPPFRFAIMATNTGLCAPSATSVGFYVTGTQKINFASVAFEISNNQSFAISSSTTSTGAADVGMSRSAANVLAIGSNSTVGDTTGRVKAAGYMSVGTTFTSNAGCTDTVLTGGATAGKFTSGATGACTTILTFGNTATAPNGWACSIQDLTTPSDTSRQVATASPTTTVSINLTASVPADVISFSCIGY